MANTAINIFGNSGEAMVGVDTLNDIIAGKQATLVSGTNIKTVNGNTLLGSGDVELTASDVGALPDNTVIPTGIEAADPADGTWTINLSNGNTITMDLNHTHPQYQPLLTAGTNISIAEDNQTGDLVISATGGGSSGNVGNLNTNNTSALTVSSSESFSGNISLHKISKTGSYNDLNNQPPIPSASTITPLMDSTAAIGSSTQYAKADHIHPSDTNKQDTLVSGTNIKTINNQSLLGSGNLTLSNIGALSVNAKSIHAKYNQSTDTFIFTDSNSNNVTQSQFREYCNDLTLYVELIFNISNVSSDNFWYFPKSLGIYQPNRDADYWTFAMFIDPRVGTTSLTLYWDSTNNKVRVEEFIDEHEIIPNVANNLTTTSSGSALDATQGKALKDLIDGITVPQAATATPLVDGTAAVGSSTKYAKEDHVHPSDTSKMSTSHPANAITSAKIQGWDNKQSQHRELGEFIQTYLENLPTSSEDARALTQEELAGLTTISTTDIWTLLNYPCGFDWDLLQNSGSYDWSANIGSVVWEYQIINDSGLYWAQFSTRDLQPKLVSGTNIKTINNQSLLGSGNLTPSDIGAITRFVVDFTLSGTTISNPNKTFLEIKAAYDAGNLVLARDDAGSLYYLLYCEDTSCGFFCSDSGMLYTIDVDSSDAWTYQDTSISQLELELSDKSQIIYMQKINNDWKKLTYNSLTGTWSVNNTTLTGNIKNIYLDKDNNDLYYWDGSEFVLIDEDNVQPDWNQSDSSKADYIKNKPTIPNSIKVGSVAGKLYRNDVAGSGNFTVKGNSGCIPNLIAGTFLVSIYAKSATQSYTFRFNFGSITYDLSTTNGEISDVRQITISSSGTFSGLVLNGSVASGTILYVVMYNYLTPVSTVGVAAVTNRYADLDGTPTIPTVNNGTLTIKNHGVTVGTFTANQSGNTTADITTEVVTVSGTGSITQALDANKFYKFGSVSALTLTLNAAGSGLAIYAGKFTASANNISITLPSGTSITDSSVDIESGNTYEFSILDGVCIIMDVTTTT